jgi:hypothetical protein
MARHRACRATHHPRDDHARVLERLAQALDRVAAELRELVEEQHPVVRECSGVSLDGCGTHLPESGRRPECPGIRSGSYWPVPKLRSLGAPSAGQARFGVTGRSRRPLPRLPRAALVPPGRADGRMRSAR